MGIVIDASVMVPFVVEHQLSSLVQKYRKNRNVVSPALVITETSNAVWKYVRVDRADIRQLLGVLPFISQFANEIVEDKLLLPSACRIAVQNSHSVYDCLYLALAQERNIPLVTADKSLANLAQKLSIETELIRPTS